MSSIGHYWRVIREALRADAERSRGHLASHESDFLPAALEVVERPVSPTGRVTSWVLIIGLVATLAWLILGKVDVVASAPGKILQSGESKIVQAAATGVVAAIHVRDGDHVKRGQVLIDLDTTLASADLEQAQTALRADQLEVERNRAFVAALDGKGLHFSPPPGTPADVAAAQQKLVSAQLAEVTSTVGGYSASRTSSMADARAAAATRAKINGTMPLLDREVDALRKLDVNGYAPGNRLLELERQRRVDQGERDVAVAQEARGASEANKYSAAMLETRDTARRQAMVELAKAQADAIQKQEDVTKAMRRSRLEHLTASTDGTVQQLAIHTVGGVAEAARTLMVIVPERDDMEVEAKVLNRDVGFVHEGQPVQVKVDAFPFTRYGSIPGTVISLSRDSVPDQHLGATFVARIHLTRGSIIVDGKPVPLGAGLGVTADIRTGNRRIISWLLSPITTTVSQAGKEQ
ncbi:HlyD family type I secretion periplasmic adaptor subunit [Novosphingobium sp.]|uniref:HlyD family type I secretion periplasmic adaptor subunit n=1 Tax=Novosphingobium sp. TaxID=1874826 RepID=UPI003D0F04A1